MKYLPNVLFFVLLFTVSLFAQSNTNNKQDEPVPFYNLEEGDVCGVKHMAELNLEIKAQPNNTELYLYRADCLKLANNPAFLEDVSTILKIKPALNDGLYTNLNDLVLKKQPAESTQAYLKFLFSANPNHWYPYDVRSKLKLQQNDYQGALDDLIRVFELKPSFFSSQLWQLSFAIEKSTSDTDAAGFYDRIYNALFKRQREFGVKLKEFPPQSNEYKELSREIYQVGSYLLSLCFNWAKRGVKLGNPQIENTALEKMIQIEPLWISFQFRSYYYKRNGNPQKASADEINYFQLLIASKQEELKQTDVPKKQAELNSSIGQLYSQLGDLYFQNEQYVKAIDNYEKAKPFYEKIKPFYEENKFNFRFDVILENKINYAIRKLNAPFQEPK